MVARIEPTARLADVLQYNEKKVAQNKAELIEARNFLQGKDKLSYEEKLQRFQHQNNLNTRSRVKTLHATLNFNPAENLSDEKLTAIAHRYMQGLQLQDQPYLVYRHNDAAHPHIHLVTSLIRSDGTRVDTNRMAQRLSVPARAAIEKEFDLMPSNRQERSNQPDTSDVQKIIPGSGIPITQAMDRILEKVNRDYSFSNLPEYNAVLRQYNVIAETGGPDSKSRRHHGLYYLALDDHGNKISPPVMASQLPTRPTLARLEKKFRQSHEPRSDDLASIRQRIDWALDKQPRELGNFVADLHADGIEVVVSARNGRNSHDQIFIDHRTKTAITSEKLGRDYTGEAIATRVAKNSSSSKTQKNQKQPAFDPEFNGNVPQVLSALLQANQSNDQAHHFQQDQNLKSRRKI